MGGNQEPAKQESDALIALFRAGRHSEARDTARRLLTRFPTSLTAWNIRGASARALGDLDEAESAFLEFERINPGFAGAPYNRGLVLEDKGQFEDAITAYRRALALDPNLAQAHNNLGAILTRIGDLDTAIAHLESARQLRPDMPEVHNSMGNALKRAHRYVEAIQAYDRAIAANPRFAQAHYNLGVIEMEHGDAERAKSAFRKVLELKPDYALARAMLVYQLAQECDWDAMAPYMESIAKLGVETEAVPPFPLLAMEDNPERQYARARKWTERRHGEAARFDRLPAAPSSRPERLKIGYFSADYHDHPGMRLIAGMLREHDRSRFEIHAIGFGRKYPSEWRDLAVRSVDHFHDVYDWSDRRVVELARSLGIHIAVDRQGYSVHSRTALFKSRLAPVQINYLGHPSTLGADFVEYIVSDPIIIPQEGRQFFAEKMIEMPHCYMPADDALEIAEPHTTRADHDLPEDAFVFCCFNNLYKITPAEFAIWMRILNRVSGSVLWLFGANSQAEANLRSHAARGGVDPDRLIFAKRVPNRDHLERHRHADLFIDTFAYNAHTTCNDALWAGLPVVTLQGEQFSARVASSLLHAVDMADFVTRSPGEYEALIMALVEDPARLLAARDKLAEQHNAARLFDTQLYTRHFEAGLDAAYDRFLRGLAPADIVVSA